jgi:hypothetical protein
MDELERLKKQASELATKLEALERRYSRLIGKVDEYVPRTTAIMREGLPLEIFSRMALMERDFQVFGLYPFQYLSESQTAVERSVDMYAVRDSVYTVPEGRGRMSGQSWPERNHLLVEVKQRRLGVQWIFAQKPTSFQPLSIAGTGVPVANSGFEIRPSEAGANTGANPKDVNNAISQLNQAYLPFYVDLLAHRSHEAPGRSWRYSSVNGKDHVYLILITNAKLRYFSPPSKLGDIAGNPEQEDQFFPEVPWVIFQPEHTAGLQYHQQKVVAAAEVSNEIIPRKEDVDGLQFLRLLAKHTHEVHIINFDHLDKVVDLVKNPPRIERIQMSLSADGSPPIDVTIDGSTSGGTPRQR